MAKEVKFNIKLTIDGKEQLVTATTNVKKFAEEFEKARSKSTRLRDDLLKITQVGASFQNAINGLQQLTGIMRSYTDANATQIEAETKLATVMRQRMGASDAEVDSIKKLASAQQELGVIGDEVQLAGAQQIATFINQKSSLETLIPAMNNLLAQQKGLSATGEDAVTIGNLMGKAMQGQSSALRRVGITFTEAQEKILKFGTESQRASMLAQIITDNVGDMNAELAKTDAGKAKQTANYIGDLKEEVGALFESIEPTIVAAGELGMAFMAVGTTVSGIKGIYVGLMGLTTAVKVSTVSTYAQAAASKIAAAAQFLWSKQLYYGREAFIAWTLGAKLAAVQAIAMRTAIMGLMAVTGVGLAIMAVSSIISLFASNTDEATDSMKAANRGARLAEEQASRLKDVEQAATDAYTNASSALEINKEKLKNLIDAKNAGKDTSKEEKKIVGELNDTYGDTMGYFDSVAKWYNALVENSEAYCRQMVIEAKTRQLANQIAEKEAESHNLIYDDKGNKKKYSTKRDQQWVVTGHSAGGYQQGEYQDIAGTSEVEKINRQVKDNRAVVANLQQQMRSAVAEAGNIVFKVKGSTKRPSTKKPTGGKNGKKELKLIANAETYKDLTNNVSYYQQELEKADITDTEHILTLARAKKAAEDAVTAFKDLTEAASVPAELKTLDDYEKKLAYLRKQKQTANKEAIAGIDAEIKETEAARQALEDEGVAALKVGEIKTYDQLNKKLAYYNRLLSSGDKAQREFAQKGINDLNKLQEAWDSELEATKLPATTNNLKDIDAAISFYSDRQQREDADQIQRTQHIIDKLTSKKKSLQLGFEIPNMQREVADINALNGKEKRLKIRGIGFDELTNKIKELNKLLNDTENPVTDSQRKDIESLIAIYERWRKQSISSFETMRNGWDSVKGIGDSVQSITDALEGNGDAWQKITAIVDSFIQLYEGIQSIVKIIGLFTSTTKKQGAAEAGKTAQTAAGTAAIAGETAATVANTTASVANTAAKSGEAVAGATASGAKMPFPYNLIAIAAGVAAVISALAAIGSFSTGGIVGGNSPTGDRLFARVNSGEMILNKNQQQRLLQMLSGVGKMSYPAIDMRQPENVNYNINSNMLQPAGDTGGTVRFEIDGRKLVGVIANETRIGSKSGRRTNIKV
nr:MAG TPA: Putative tail length tape measure protein [Caudoviricetes sp.]